VKNKKIAVVTGAAGFLGSFTVERLLDEGYVVRALDLPGAPFNINLKNVLTHERLTIIKGDLLSIPPDDSLYSGVEYILHFAGLTELTQAKEKPEIYTQVNLMGTVRLLEAARQLNIKKFINMSTAAVYGHVKKWPITEDAPKNPINAYGLSKWFAEQAVEHWHEVYGVPTLIFRMFNGYGPRSNHNDVFGVFMKKRKAGEAITITGDGSALRDFVFVTDIVDAFIKGLESTQCGKTYNIGSGNPRSIKDLAKLFSDDIQYLPKRENDPPVICADINNIQKDLGWNPGLSLEEGITKLLNE
jgi:UDP-glucose 4-epimerase